MSDLPPPPPGIAGRGWAYTPGQPRTPSPFEAWMAASIQRLEPAIRAPRTALLAAIAVGILANITLEAGIPGIGLTLFAVTCSAVAFVLARRRSRQAQAFAIVSAGLSLPFAILTSPWVVALCLFGVAASLLTSASLSRGGNVFDLPWEMALIRTCEGAGHAVLSLPWLGRAGAHLVHGAAGSRPRPVIRGVALAFPVVLVLGLLLSGADPLFASLFAISFDTNAFGLHIGVWVLGAVIVATLMRIARSQHLPETSPWSAPRLGSTEGIVVIGSIAVLYAAFTATQVAAVLGAGRDLLVAEGLTYSQYARSGYFQMLAVVALTTVLLPPFKDLVHRQHSSSHWIRWLCALVVLLTLGIGVAALRRLSLYDDVYGLTMLRFGCAFGAALFALLLLFSGASLLGVKRATAWLPGAALVSLLVFIGAFAVINPEAYVARFNVEHIQSVPLDTGYLASLSSDAVPALVTALPRVDHQSAHSLRTSLCGESQGTSWSTWTASRSAASSALRSLCG